MPDNYREVPFHLNGEDIIIAGFARPKGVKASRDAFRALSYFHQVGAVISLSKQDYRTYYEQAGLDPDFYFKSLALEVPDYFHLPYHRTARIPPKTYDEIYRAVSTAQQHGKKVAIHCGAGDGRTGTALATLKLRELMERACETDFANFRNAERKSVQIEMKYNVQGKKGGYVWVTPTVARAITEVRNNSTVFTASGFTKGHPGSVETRNDVESLMVYQHHLHNQLLLRKVQQLKAASSQAVEKKTEPLETKTLPDALVPQVEAALAAIQSGKSRATETIVNEPVKKIEVVADAKAVQKPSYASVVGKTK